MAWVNRARSLLARARLPVRHRVWCGGSGLALRASGVDYALTPVRSVEASMIRTTAGIALGLVAATVALAQTSPPTYQADPDVYKVIFEDANFRVIAATWKKGARDKDHAHPSASVIYSVTDCALKVYTPDGKSRDVQSKAGSAMAVPSTQSHHAENVGASDCQAVFVERK